MDLNYSTIELYAYNNYKTNSYIMQEFYSDYKRIINIKKLIGKYKNNKELKDRLLLNNLILFYNVFNMEAATRMLFFRVDECDYSILKTVLTYLNYMPDVIYNINGRTIRNMDIPIDVELFKTLKDL